MSDSARILVVDDVPENVRLLDAVLSSQGYEILQATDGRTALELASTAEPDLVLLDVLMPGIDGYEVCRRLREREETAVLPVIMLTASDGQEKTKAIEAGADDFIPKPFDRDELFTRIRSLLRIKRYHDTIKAQATQLRDLNRTLEERVQTQVEELERMAKLRRFLSPQLAELIVDSGDESFLESHRREIVVVFCDLRGFTTFAESSEPEEVTTVLREYHDALGDLIHRFEGTLERFTGDGLMVFFNDPMPCDDAPLRAIRMSLAMRDRVQGLAEAWSRRGFDLSLGIGLAQGYATLGRIGFEGRFDYAAIGSVTNLAARLCASAEPWQVLAQHRVVAEAGDAVVSEELGSRDLRGFSRPIRTCQVRGLDLARVTS